MRQDRRPPGHPSAGVGQAVLRRPTTRRAPARLAHPEAVEQGLVVAPAAAHAHRQLEVHVRSPARARARRRAAVPIALTMRPPAPIRIAFWDSLSTQISARTRVSSARGRSISSITTSTACGTSWKVRRITASRISSASSCSSGWSLLTPGSNRNGPSGTLWARCSTSSATPGPRAPRSGRSRPRSQLGGVGERLQKPWAGEPVDLVDGDRDRHLATGHRARRGGGRRARRPARR